MLRRELEKEKSPSPISRIRSVGENGMVGGGGFAPFVGLRKEEWDFVFVVESFVYGLELEALICFFALPIAGVRVRSFLRRATLEVKAFRPTFTLTGARL